jgi:hypothetical protein
LHQAECGSEITVVNRWDEFRPQGEFLDELERHGYISLLKQLKKKSLRKLTSETVVPKRKLRSNRLVVAVTKDSGFLTKMQLLRWNNPGGTTPQERLLW